LIEAATERARVRVLFPASLAAGAGPTSAACFPVPDLPHDLLFQRVAAVVHHGGAGTFASAALAGCPQGVVAHLGDQYYHGYRIETLGVGPAPLPARRLTVARLARLLAQLASEAAFATSAQALAPRIRRDGADQAVKIIEAIVTGAA